MTLFPTDTISIPQADATTIMKDLTLLASFVAPCTRSGRALCNEHASSMRKLGDSANGLTLRAEPMVSSIAAQEPTGVYEAVMPQTETLVGMGFILVLCVTLYWVWENQVVPVSRTKLAISKSRGEVKEYLNELKASTPNVNVGETMSSEAASTETGELVLQTANATTISESTTSDPATLSPAKDDRAFERWLFTDWLEDNKSERKGGRQKEPALPILKSAKWNSGDNPVVVAAFLMLVGLVFTALTERLAVLG